MKVKDLIEKLKKYDENKEVLIRFAVSDEDEIGYYLRPTFTDLIATDVYIYASYDTTEEDCDFIGQYDLKKLWEDEYNKNFDNKEVEKDVS